MNTTSPRPASPAVGLVNLPRLSALLAQIGFTVVTGPSERDAVAAIRSTLNAGTPAPILISDQKWAGIKAWVNSMRPSTQVVVLRVVDGGGDDFGDAPVIVLPATVGDIVAAAGLPPVHPQVAAYAVAANGEVAPSLAEAAALAPAPQPSVTLDPPAQPVAAPAPVPVAAPAAMPVMRQPVATPPVQQSVQASPPAPPVVQQPVPQPVAVPVPQPAVPAVAVPVPHPSPASPIAHQVAPSAYPPPPPVQPVAQPVAPQPVPVPAGIAYQAPPPSYPEQQLPTFPTLGQHHQNEPETNLGEVCVIFAAKGGVGKSTMSVSLSQRAAAAGLRVIVIDGNFGQGDLRTFLRIGNAGLPSIYQAALSGDMHSALVDPDTLNESRSLKLDPLNFAVIQAPPPHLADSSIVTPDVYRRVVEQAREIADLVVIDTQIIEPGKEVPMIVKGFIEPILREYAWGLGVTDLSSPGISNLLTCLKRFAGEGVPRTRMLAALNKVPPSTAYNGERAASALSEHAFFLGQARADEDVIEQMNLGRSVASNPSLSPILDGALARLFPQGLSFDHFDAPAAPAQETEKKAGFLARIGLGKK